MSSILSIQKINKEIVIPINIPKIETSKIKGYDLFEELYTNIYILAKKKSGKIN